MNRNRKDVAKPDTRSHHPSVASVQGELEAVLLDRIQASEKDWTRVEWFEASVNLGLEPVWQRVELDRVWKTRRGHLVIAECYCRVGVLNPRHRRKLALDVLKLVAIRERLPTPDRVHGILVVPNELEQQLRGEAWLAVAIRALVSDRSGRSATHFRAASLDTHRSAHTQPPGARVFQISPSTSPSRGEDCNLCG